MQRRAEASIGSQLDELQGLLSIRRARQRVKRRTSRG
jgi:hypothetical protein